MYFEYFNSINFFLFLSLLLKETVVMQPESAFVLSESGKLLVKPYVEQLPDLFVSYFKEILKVGYKIPRLEYYMSQRKYGSIIDRK